MIEGNLKIPNQQSYKISDDKSYPYNVAKGLLKRRIVNSVWTPYQSDNTPESVDPYIPVLSSLLPGWSNLAVFSQPGSIDGDLFNNLITITISYNATYMKADFSDLRFATWEGQLIDYYVSSKTDGVSATFILKVPYIEVNPATTFIMVYAGNTNAASTSNYNNVYGSYNTTTNPPNPGTLGAWSATREITTTLSLGVHGTVFGESPTSPLPAASFGVTAILGDGEYTNLTGLTIDKDKSSSTFEVEISSSEDELFMSGQEILLNKHSGHSSKKLYLGLLQDVKEKRKNANRSYALSGRGMSLPLINAGFTWVCGGARPSLKYATEIIDLILAPTNIERGPGIDVNGIGKISNNTKQSRGWCGSFDTRKAAIDSLLSLVSEYKGRVINWFIDKDNLFRTFYADDRDNDLGIVITDTNPRIISCDVSENSESIINDITGYYGSKGTLKVHLQDTESIYGWTTDEGVERPGYGIIKGEDIKNTNIGSKTRMTNILQMILDRLSKPIYNVDLELARFPEVEPGQPLYLPDHPRVNDLTFIVSKVKIDKKSTKITATTDLNAVSPPSDYQSVRAVAQKAVRKSAPKTGTIIEDNGTYYVIQLDSGGSFLNVDKLS